VTKELTTITFIDPNTGLPVTVSLFDSALQDYFWNSRQRPALGAVAVLPAPVILTQPEDGLARPIRLFAFYP